MKKLLIAAFIAVVILSCSKNEHGAPKSAKQTYYFTVETVNNDGTIDQYPLVAELKN